jgi:hypothetical protein
MMIIGRILESRGCWAKGGNISVPASIIEIRMPPLDTGYENMPEVFDTLRFWWGNTPPRGFARK